eukprot:2918608-Alexandrium_andersonii.AAC.1
MAVLTLHRQRSWKPLRSASGRSHWMVSALQPVTRQPPLVSASARASATPLYDSAPAAVQVDNQPGSLGGRKDREAGAAESDQRVQQHREIIRVGGSAPAIPDRPFDTH